MTQIAVLRGTTQRSTGVQRAPPQRPTTARGQKTAQKGRNGFTRQSRHIAGGLLGSKSLGPRNLLRSSRDLLWLPRTLMKVLLSSHKGPKRPSRPPLDLL